MKGFEPQIIGIGGNWQLLCQKFFFLKNDFLLFENKFSALVKLSHLFQSRKKCFQAFFLFSKISNFLIELVLKQKWRKLAKKCEISCEISFPCGPRVCGNFL